MKEDVGLSIVLFPCLISLLRFLFESPFASAVAAYGNRTNLPEVIINVIFMFHILSNSAAALKPFQFKTILWGGHVT
jgi:hypothetical protein